MVKYQTFDFPFRGGVNDKIAEQIMPTGMLELGRDVRQRKTGELSKRDGSIALNMDLDGEATIRLHGLYSRNNESLLCIGTAKDPSNSTPFGPMVFGYNEGTGTGDGDDWIPLGGHGVSEVTVHQGSHSTNDMESETAKLVTPESGRPQAWVYAYTRGGEVVISVWSKDHSTFYGGTTASDAASATGRPRIATESTGAAVYWQSSSNSATNLKVANITLTDIGATFSTGTFLSTQLSTDGTFAVTDIEGTTDHLITYKSQSLNQYRVARVGATTYFVEPIPGEALVANTPMAIIEDGTHYYVAYFRTSPSNQIIIRKGLLSDGSNVSGPGNTFSTIGATPTQITITKFDDAAGGSFKVFWELTGTGPFTHKKVGAETVGNASSSSAQEFFHRSLYSDAFSFDGVPYVWVGHHLTGQTLYALMSVHHFDYVDVLDNNPKLMAKCFYTQAGDGRDSLSLTQVSKITDTEFGTGLRRVDGFGGSTSDLIMTVRNVTVDMGPTPIQGVQLGNSLEIPGAIVQSVVGGAVDLGFTVPPAGTFVKSAGSGNIDAGDHSFRAIFTWYDAAGNLHRSAPSIAKTDTFAASDSVTYDVELPFLWDRELNTSRYDISVGKMTLELYMTTAGGSVHYHFADVDIARATTGSVVAENITATVAGLSDTDLLSRKVLYIDSGELAADAPPPATRMVRRTDRYFCIPDDKRNVVRYSKPRAPGLAPEFNELLEVPIFGKQDLEGLAVLDSKVIVFEPRRILVFGGAGPNALGSGAFTPISEIASDVGCIEHRSIMSTERGVIFKSLKGWYLLNRALQLEYIGGPVEDHNSFNVITAIKMDDEREYRAYVRPHDDPNEAKDVLVYDTYHGQWYKDRYSISFSDYITAVAMWKNAPVYAYWDNTAGTDKMELRRETSVRADPDVTQSWVDPTGIGYTMLIRTGWIRPAGLNGYVRIRRVGVLGEWKSSHTLRISVYTLEDPNTPAVTQDFVNTSDIRPYQFRVRLPRDKQKTSGIMVQVSTLSSTGEQATFHGLTLDIGLKQGIRKLGASRSA